MALGLHGLRGSGLDTSNGAEFVKERVALFAKIVCLIALAFLVIGVTTGLVVFHRPVRLRVFNSETIAHAAGTLLAAVVWLVCRRARPLSLSALELLDAVALVGCCTAWALFIQTQSVESVYTGVIAVTLTVLVRSTVVPSKAGRTLRLAVLAHVPVALVVWMRAGPPVPILGRLPDAPPPLFTAINQTIWSIAVIAVATVTSRVIYELRRKVKEANELGPYTLEDRLGAGGMGEVWRARHRFLARDAAVKLIRPEPLMSTPSDPDVLLRRFEREACATAALRSPHTVQLYDFGQSEDGTLYYVMEMLVGVDLEMLVSRFGPVPAERAIHILKQVCHSLDEAHQNGLTHRDIKPANIFVSAIGTELDFVKVLDFGLVRLQHERLAPDQVKLTAEGKVGGTPAYMAPEIVVGGPHYDHRVDIYSVGCVGYWLVTGKLVFEGDTAMKMMLDHARTPPPRPQTRTELAIPPELEQVIMDCLEKDPERRPATAAELARRLSACPTPERWTRERAERWWRTHLPQHLRERPVAELLLSHEGAPAHARELRPRRAQP